MVSKRLMGETRTVQYSKSEFIEENEFTIFLRFTIRIRCGVVADFESSAFIRCTVNVTAESDVMSC